MGNIPYAARAKVYDEALAVNGADVQLLVAIEEMSESTKTLCKAMRGMVSREDIATEVADVLIGMEQVVRIFGIQSEVDAQMDYKIQRLHVKVVKAQQEKTGGTELRRLGDSFEDKQYSGLLDD